MVTESSNTHGMITTISCSVLVEHDRYAQVTGLFNHVLIIKLVIILVIIITELLRLRMVGKQRLVSIPG